MKYFAIAFLFLLTVSCASKQEWYLNKKTNAQFQQDCQECRAHAKARNKSTANASINNMKSPYQEVQLFGLGGLLLAAASEESDFEKCLTQKGYTKAQIQAGLTPDDRSDNPSQAMLHNHPGTTNKKKRTKPYTATEAFDIIWMGIMKTDHRPSEFYCGQAPDGWSSLNRHGVTKDGGSWAKWVKCASANDAKQVADRLIKSGLHGTLSPESPELAYIYAYFMTNETNP